MRHCGFPPVLKLQLTFTLFPSSSLGTQLCRSSSFGSHEAVPKLQLTFPSFIQAAPVISICYKKQRSIRHSRRDKGARPTRGSLY